MTYQEFVSGPAARQRYWARSHLGWGRMRHAEPNAGHRALARLDPDLLITQNVDGLHERAGSRAAGRAARPDRRRGLPGLPGDVSPAPRSSSGWPTLNPGFAERHATPRGRGPTATSTSTRPPTSWCPGATACGGVLKPDVVFFGENVPAPRVERCYAAVDALAEHDGALLVAGSSLTVMSGLRFVRRAPRRRRPGRDRQPRRDPRRRAGDVQARRRAAASSSPHLAT